MGTSLRVALSGIVLTASTPALGWTEHNTESRCGFSQTFDDEGETTLLVFQTKNNFDSRSVAFALFSDGWSVTDDQKLQGRLRFTASDEAWMDADPTAMDKGVGGLFDEEYVANFDSLSVTGVRVTLNGKPLAVMNWSGFWSAYRDFNRCRDKMGWMAERKAKEAEEERLKRLKDYRREVPLDPFATPPAPPKPKAKGT